MGIKKNFGNRVFNEKKSLLYWTILISVGLILLVSPFSKGLFNGYSASFDTAIMTFQSCLFGVGILFTIYLMFKPSHDRGTDVVHWLVWVLPLMYIIPLLISPASSYHASQAVYLHVAFGLAFAIGFYLNRTAFSTRILLTAILGSGSLIIIFGFMNWFGDASLWGLMNWNYIGGTSQVYKDAVLAGSDGARLTSIFQYANSYAAYLIALVLSFLVLLVNSKKIQHIFFFSLLLVPAIISLMLTLSRGGLLVFPIVILITLPFLKWYRQLFMIVYLVASAIIVMIVLNPISNLGHSLQQQFNTSDMLKGWGILIVASIASALLNVALHTFLFRKIKSTTRTHIKKLPLNALIPACLLLLGTITLLLLLSTNVITSLLPGSLQERIKNINFEQNSVLERGTFYTDAWKVVKDYPLFGAGGGSWASMYEKYQNNPYISNQTHNYFMQLLVEVGVIGFIAFLLFIILIFIYFIRSYYKREEEQQSYYLIYFIIVAAILIHSILDFNMSFIYLSFLVYLCLGGMLAANEIKPFTWQERWAAKSTKYIYPVSLLGLFIILTLISLNQLTSNKEFHKVQMNAGKGLSFQQLNQTIDSAINKLNNPEYINLKLQILFSVYKQTNDQQYASYAEEILKTYKKEEPYFKPFIYRELELRLMNKEYDQAVQLLESEVNNYPWDITMYSELASVYFQSGLFLLEEGSSELALKEWDHAATLLKRVQDKADYLESLPEHQYQGREFGLTADFALPLGQIAYYKGDYTLAEQYLLMRMDQQFNDAKDIETATYYIATLKKLQKDDISVAQDMFSKVSEEIKQTVKDQLETLLAQTAVTK